MTSPDRPGLRRRSPRDRAPLRARAIAAAALVAGAAFPSPSAAQESAPDIPAPSRVVLFVADGAGVAHWTVALFENPASPLLRFPVGGLVDTRNVEDRITDSAAAATSFATGVLTRNRHLGVDADGAPLATILERAAERGLATGLVVTSTVTHATPAAFAAHVTDRDAHEEIAAQLAESPLRVLLGGGLRWFDPAMRRDGADALGLLRRGKAWAERAEDLDSAAAAAVAAGQGLAGLFASESPPRSALRSPTLAGMTAAALRVLEVDPDGFFLMVEASQVDWRSHDNESWSGVADELRDADEALAVLLAYVERNPETLLVVTADHETGGAAVVEGPHGAWELGWVGDDHTADLVPLFAAGRGAERFGGVRRIDAVGRLLSEALLPPPADTN
jgi:alkaline phosphatase